MSRRPLHIIFPGRVRRGKCVAVAKETWELLPGSVLAADEEDGVAHLLDQEAELVLLPEHEAEQVAEGAAACDDVDVGDERGFGLQQSGDGWLVRMVRISSRVAIAVEDAFVLLELRGDGGRFPERGFAFQKWVLVLVQVLVQVMGALRSLWWWPPLDEMAGGKEEKKRQECLPGIRISGFSKSVPIQL